MMKRLSMVAFVGLLTCLPAAMGHTILTVGLADKGKSALLMDHKEVSFEELAKTMRQIAELDAEMPVRVRVRKEDSAVAILKLVALVHDAGMTHVNFFHYSDKPRHTLLVQATVKAAKKEMLPEEEKVIEEVLEEIPIEVE